MIEITLVALPPREELAAQWRALEQRSEASFFLTWSWIGCWLDSLGNGADLRLLRVTEGATVVGLGLLAWRHEWRHGLILSRNLRLHATGRPEFDVLTIECNGFLLERQREADLLPRIQAYLFEAHPDLDELIMDGLWARHACAGRQDARMRALIREVANHYVELERVRTHGDYLALLSARTRAHIRRSRREYEKLGPLTVRAPADSGEALRFFDRLEILHQQYWVSRDQPGAFASSFFKDFHRRLIEDSFRRGEIQLLCIEAGDHQLGYLYNFVHRNRVYVYQSGFDYKVCARYNQPGLTSHAAAIALNAQEGRDVYDFLAGDSHYKRRLATATEAMLWLKWQRNLLRFRAEESVRRLRRRWSTPLARQPASA